MLSVATLSIGRDVPIATVFEYPWSLKARSTRLGFRIASSAHRGVIVSDNDWQLAGVTAESREFWEAARRRELRIQRCSACQKYQHYPRVICVHCQSDVLDWVTVPGHGEIHSFTVVHRPPFEDLDAFAPYVVALIDLDEGVRLLSWVVETAIDQVAIGNRVTVEFLELPSGPVLPVFVPSPAS